MNTATPSTRLPRWIAVLVAGALVALGSVVSVSPAAAATGDIVGGSATWGISTYLNAGTFGRPSPLVASYVAPATYSSTTKLSSWGNATGHVNNDGSAALSFAGTSVNFTATGGGWLTLADLQATLDSAGNGTVSALVSYGLAPGTYPNITFDPAQAPQRGPERVTVVTLAGNTAGATVTTASASWSGLTGTWSSSFLAYLQGDGGSIPAWAYASAITNDSAVAGPRTALPFAFSVNFEGPKTFNAGTATWGISTYLNAGTFGRPSPAVAGYVAPATYSSTTKLSTWGDATGTLYGDGSATLAYSGTSANFTATGGGWLRLADPQVTLDPRGNGSVTALVSYGLAPGTYPNITYSPTQAPQRGPQRVEIVALAGNSVAAVQGTNTASWSGLAGTWSSTFLAYLQGDGAGVPAWAYAATITNDAAVAGARTALPFSFTLGVAPLTATTTMLTAAPTTQAAEGDDVILTATVAPALAGSVQFSNGSTVLATVPVAAGTASHTITDAAAGDYALTAVFTPADTAHHAGSTGTLAYAVNAPVPAAPGSLTWGIKLSLQSYVLGGGSITTSSGAGYNGVRFSFPQTSSESFNHASATGTSSYGGTATFAYPAHGFSISISKPRIVLTSATAGTLYADVTYNGSTSTGVAFASLSLGGATTSTTGTTTTFSNVSATLTAAGASAFQGFYTAGVSLDPMSFVVGAPSAAFASVSKSAKVNEPDATPPASEGIESETEPVEGEEFTATASGFAPNEDGILVVIYSEPLLLDTTTADANGTVHWSGDLPTGLTGEHTLTFQGSVDRGIVLDIQPAAATEAATGCLVESGDLTWGFKESFRSYISGSIANGEWTVADGATYETPNFGFTGATGAYDPATSTGQVDFTGSITFTGHGGILNTTVANPSIRFDDADTAYVLLDVAGTTQEGAPQNEKAIEFVELDLSAATVDNADGVVTVTAAPATLTAAGSEAFGTYETGEAFDPITLSFATEDCAAAAPEEATVAPEPAASTTDLTWLWIVLAVLIVLAVIATVVIVRRRRVTA